MERNFMDTLYSHSVSNPKHFALVDSNKQLTYEEFISEIDSIVNILKSKNLENKIVALQIPRTIYFPIIVMALTKLNITFIPQDITQPKERLNQMIDIARANYIITLDNDNQLNFEKKNYLDNKKTKAWAIYFTSGSTGLPKAVEVPINTYENTVLWEKELFSLDVNSKVAAYTPFSFAISYIELFSTLFSGGTVFILNNSYILP